MNELLTVLFSLLVAAVVVGSAAIRREVREAVKEDRRLGARKPFNFSDDWAANFTVLGAVFNSILSASGSPDSPAPFASWHSYQLLGVLFAATTTVAPFVYFGRIRSFLFATALTLAAVIGQALTAFLVSYAIGSAAEAKGAPGLVTFLLIIVVAYGFAGSLVYVWKGIPRSVRASSSRDRPPESREARAPSWPPWLWG
jgi:hypothetical protein